MDGFKQFITSSKLVSEKKISYYINWINKFLSYQGKIPDGNVLPSAIDHFFNGLQRKIEGWQVAQAEEAIRLYCLGWLRFFYNFPETQFCHPSAGRGV